MFPAAGTADEAGKVARRGDYVKYSYQVVLPSDMSKALKEYSPAFRIFGLEDFSEDHKRTVLLPFSGDLCYSAVFTDINGDGRDDAVVYGEADLWVEHRSSKGTEREEYFPALALLSEGTTGYRVVQVSRGIAHRPIEKSLTVLAAGTAVDDWDHATVDIRDNDIGLIVGENLLVFRWQGKGAAPEFKRLPPVKAASYKRKGK